MLNSGFSKRAVHLDFHTMPGVYDVGKDFNAKDFVKTLVSAGVDYITVFARCNLGFAYYPTKIGVVHPSLKIDLLGQMVAACHKHGIKVVAYFNAGLDHEHALRHREWCKVNKEGQVYEMQGLGRGNNFFRTLCLNTGYADHLLAMAKEVLEKYPVDGLFMDCFNAMPCYGVECLDAMKAAGTDLRDEHQVQAFAKTVNDAFAAKVTKAVQKIRKNLYLCFNGLPYRSQPRHLELEILPMAWGYDLLPLAIRYARTLGKPYFTMTGRFHKSWGDFGGIRPKESLLFDCFNSIANGGTCSIGDHLHPRGKLESQVYDLIHDIYSRTRELDPWTEHANPLAEIVVLDPALREYPRHNPNIETPWQGAARMLMELKYQFDLSDGDADLSRYKVIVLPDQVTLDDRLTELVRSHLKKGGILISSGFSGLNPEKNKFVLNEYGLDYQGLEPFNISFFKASPEVSRDLPDMLTTIYTPGISMQARKGVEILAKLYQPYFNKYSWDWRHENLYIPPEKDTGRPALTRCGNVFHFSFPIFANYFEHAVVAYKSLIRNCIESAFPKPLIKVKGMPSFGQVTMTRQGKRRIVHLLTYVPELRGRQVQVIEEPINVRNIELSIRIDGQKIKKVYLAPSQTPLDFHLDAEYVKITVPEVSGYQMVVFE